MVDHLDQFLVLEVHLQDWVVLRRLRERPLLAGRRVYLGDLQDGALLLRRHQRGASLPRLLG